MDLIGKLLDHLGFATPFIYAAAAYGFFAWLDGNASDEAKRVLADTMKIGRAENKEIAAALVEFFDRLYSYPLLTWRSFARSLIFTSAIFAVYLYEGGIDWLIYRIPDEPVLLESIFAALAFNILTDYASLFVIRHWLTLAGVKPVFGLMTGAAIGAFIVSVAALLRAGVFLLLSYLEYGSAVGKYKVIAQRHAFIATLDYSIPATIIFGWLLLLALGIVVCRAATPFSWITGGAIWALRDGDKHPLKAVGCIAAIIVFLIAVSGHLIFKT
jgi:hypothetical protein